MKFDVTVFAEDLNAASDLAQAVEDIRISTGSGWRKRRITPFCRWRMPPWPQSASRSARRSRSPFRAARCLWRGRPGTWRNNPAAVSSLGLGTQIKPHITKRFSAKWGKPVGQLREYILALRAIWGAFQTGDELCSQGRYYSVSLAAAEKPRPLPFAEIPIYIAGVNTGLARLAGELCEGFHVHSFHTPRYLRETLLPAFESGRARGGRDQPLSLSCAVFVVTGEDEAAIAESKRLTKSQIAFYASTPSYQPVLERHGWQDLRPQLNALLRRNRWEEMHQLISDEMLEQFAVVAPPDELPYKLRERYQWLA